MFSLSEILLFLILLHHVYITWTIVDISWDHYQMAYNMSIDPTTWKSDPIIFAKSEICGSKSANNSRTRCDVVPFQNGFRSFSKKEFIVFLCKLRQGLSTLPNFIPILIEASYKFSYSYCEAVSKHAICTEQDWIWSHNYREIYRGLRYWIRLPLV